MTANSYDKVGAYKTQQDSIINGREIDCRALLKTAGRLQALLDAPVMDIHEYGEAIKYNQKLWTIFQVSLCDPDNELPRELKIILLNLSRYVDKVSFKALSGQMPELLKSLIDINRILAVGLAKKVEGGQPTISAFSMNMPSYPSEAAAAPTSVLTSA